MKEPVELGKYIVADPLVCHGKPTYKGSRVMVWQVLEALEEGESWDEIIGAWPGAVTREAIAETIRLARSAMLSPDGRAKPATEVVSHAAKPDRRPFGLCAGDFSITDDFDSPLPEGILLDFEGR